MTTQLLRLETWHRQVTILVCICFVTLVGWVDYITGYETFCFTFYLLPILAGTWRVSAFFGALMSALSVTAWVSSNIEAGAHYSSYFVPVWNALIMFAVYLIIVFLLHQLKIAHLELEERVRQRTADLTSEIQQRTRLQKEFLETTDREQRRIGRELHDGLCQHLTGTALAGHLLEQKLAGQSSAEAGKAARLVSLVEQAIDMTRNLSHELDPVEVPAGKWVDHFEDLAASTGQRFKLSCHFACRLPPSSRNIDAPQATHLYRIAQVAVTEAAKRRQARQIHIELDSSPEGIVMSIADDGLFQPGKISTDTLDRLQDMTCRADLMGARLSVEPRGAGGDARHLPAAVGPINHAGQN